METSLCTQIATDFRKAGPSPQPLQTSSSMSFSPKSGVILASPAGIYSRHVGLKNGTPDLSAAWSADNHNRSTCKSSTTP